jgi:transcriptional regulator with XRE-family HTH domain
MAQHPRPKPKHLAAKLLAIRQRLGVSQSEMVRLLNTHLTSARISEYESGAREPSLMTVLAYSRAARVRVERIIDDDLDLF